LPGDWRRVFRDAVPDGCSGGGIAGIAGPAAEEQAGARAMKADIHPNYQAVKATCSCGNVIETRSTLGQDFSIDVCSNCHPFFTGKQKIVDSGGRVDRFKKRFGSRGSAR
jgi:large subunit ribosomal protein L31